MSSKIRIKGHNDPEWIHPALELRKTDESYGIFATEVIPLGCIVIESVVRFGVQGGVLTVNEMAKLILANHTFERVPGQKEFFESLWPRTSGLDEVGVAEKLAHNAFVGNRAYTAALVEAASYLNHSCGPNVIQIWEDEVCSFFTIKVIQPGEELTICYDSVNPVDSKQERDRRLHELPFTCICRFCKMGINPSGSRALAVTKHCWFCGVDCTRRCTSCKKAYYCSPACQKANWAQHKTVCAIHAAMPEELSLIGKETVGESRGPLLDDLKPGHSTWSPEIQELYRRKAMEVDADTAKRIKEIDEKVFGK